jgi:hypothetical protein
MDKQVTIEKITTEGKELHVRTGDLLPQVAYKFTPIEGTITAPKLYAEKMKETIETIHEERLSTIIIASIPDGFISLFVAKDDPNAAIVKGSLKQSPESLRLGINNGDYISTYEMSQLLKMNRAIFENIATANELISKMQKFEATINKTIADQNDGRANTKLLQEQAVTTNLPNAFNILISVYKGDERQKIEIEIYIDPNTMKCTLVSPEFQELLDKSADEIISKEIAELKELLPKVPVLYQ